MNYNQNAKKNVLEDVTVNKERIKIMKLISKLALLAALVIPALAQCSLAERIKKAEIATSQMRDAQAQGFALQSSCLSACKSRCGSKCSDDRKIKSKCQKRCTNQCHGQ